jgi:hypothetical protein
MLVRRVGIVLFALSAVIAALCLVSIWHYVSFRLHGTDTNSSLNVSFGGYPWQERVSGVLIALAALSATAVTLWLLLRLLGRPRVDNADDEPPEPPEPVELVPAP